MVRYDLLKIQRLNIIDYHFFMFYFDSFLKLKKEIPNNNAEDPIINKNLQEIINTIEEFSDEQREIVEKFKIEMELFTTERTLESCLQSLNLSMQLVNTREKLLLAYKEYCNLLENELKKKLMEERRKKIWYGRVKSSSVDRI